MAPTLQLALQTVYRSGVDLSRSTARSIRCFITRLPTSPMLRAIAEGHCYSDPACGPGDLSVPAVLICFVEGLSPPPAIEATTLVSARQCARMRCDAS